MINSKKSPKIPRKFPVSIDVKRHDGGYSPDSPYLPKVAKTVATKIVAKDGSGDFEDIQQAINDLPSGGGVVYIKEGTYNITSAISINKNYVSLIGAGKSTKIATTSSINLVSASSKQGIFIDKIYFFGPGNATTYGVLLSSTSDSFISNCWFENCGTASEGIGAVGLNTCTNVIVANSIFTDNISAGIVVIGGSYILLDSNVIDTCTDTSYGIGIYIESASKVKITGNTLKSCGVDGIQLSASVSCSIVGNNIESNTSRGIYFLTGCTDCTIAGNTIIGALYGIVLNNSSDRNSVSSNSISATTDTAILIYETSKDNVISSNVCYNCTNYGIYLLDCDKNVINSNRCMNNAKIEIWATTGSESNTIVGNIALGTHVSSIVNTGSGNEVGHNIS